MVDQNQQYFEEVQAFIDDLEDSGHIVEAKIVLDGFSCINGLTDGWALFLGALLKIESQKTSGLSDSQKKILKDLCDVAYRAVYRMRRTSGLRYRFSFKSWFNGLS